MILRYSSIFHLIVITNDSVMGVIISMDTHQIVELEKPLSSTHSSSYFWLQCFPTALNEYIFTMTLWIYPTTDSIGENLSERIFSGERSGAPCFDYLGLTSDRQIVMPFLYTMTKRSDCQGPVSTENTWIHVDFICISLPGMRLLVLVHVLT